MTQNHGNGDGKGEEIRDIMFSLFDESDFKSYTKDQLKKECERRGLKSTGIKDCLMYKIISDNFKQSMQKGKILSSDKSDSENENQNLITQPTETEIIEKSAERKTTRSKTEKPSKASKLELRRQQKIEEIKKQLVDLETSSSKVKTPKVKKTQRKKERLFSDYSSDDETDTEVEKKQNSKEKAKEFLSDESSESSENSNSEDSEDELAFPASSGRQTFPLHANSNQMSFYVFQMPDTSKQIKNFSGDKRFDKAERIFETVRTDRLSAEME